MTDELWPARPRPEVELEAEDLDTSDRAHILQVLSYVGTFLAGAASVLVLQRWA